MNDLFKLILSLSVSGSIISIIIFITKFIVKNKFSKSWQYYIWFILVLRLLLPFTVEINLVGSLFEEKQIESIEVENTIHIEVEPTEPLQVYDVEAPTESIDYFKLLTSNIWLIWILGIIVLLAIKITDYRGFINYIKSSISSVEEEEILEIFDDVFIELKLKQNIDIYKSNIIKSLIRKLAPYANKSSIDKAINKYCATSSNIDLDSIRKLAPYANKSSIDTAIKKYCETFSNFNLDTVRSLAPYATSSSIDYFIEKALLNKKVTYKDLKPLLSYASNDSIDKFIDKILTDN